MTLQAETPAVRRRNGRARVVLMEDYLDQARTMACVQELARVADLEIVTTKARDRDEVLQRLDGAEVVITIRDRVMFDAGLLSQVKGLDVLSVCGPRLQPHVDLEAATRAGVLVCASPPNSLSSDPHHATAELTWTLILAAARNVVHNHSVMRAGGWQTIAGMGLAGKTLGIIGSTGKVGSLIVRIGLAFGMRVIAWSPRLTPEKAAAQGTEAVTLDELLRTSDIVTLHANATAESRSMLGDAELGKMKKSAYLVNAARAAAKTPDNFPG